MASILKAISNVVAQSHVSERIERGKNLAKQDLKPQLPHCNAKTGSKTGFKSGLFKDKPEKGNLKNRPI